jgi:hypothetical protein
VVALSFITARMLLDIAATGRQGFRIASESIATFLADFAPEGLFGRLPWYRSAAGEIVALRGAEDGKTLLGIKEDRIRAGVVFQTWI